MPPPPTLYVLFVLCELFVLYGMYDLYVVNVLYGDDRRCRQRRRRR